MGRAVLTHAESYREGGTNLLANPDFEANPYGWRESGVGAAVERSTDEAHKGEASLEVTTNGELTGCQVLRTIVSTPGLDITRLEAGEEHEFSAWIKTEPFANLLMRVSSDGNLFDEPFIGTGDWEEISVIWTYTPTDSGLGPILSILADQGENDDPVFYVDDAAVKRTHLIAPFDISGDRIWIEPGDGCLYVKIREGDSDAESDQGIKPDGTIEPVDIEVYARPAFPGLSDQLEG